jgi:hypothetical protein
MRCVLGLPIGFSPAQRRVSGLLIPLFNARGECVRYQFRPDEPRMRDGKLVKYESPSKSEIEALEDAGGADVTISNHPLAIAPGHPSIVSRSKQLKFRDHGYTLDLSGTTGQCSPFTYEG